MKKLLWLPVIAAAVLGIWAVARKSEPPQVPFTKVKRETLTSTLPTNGKSEPLQWQAVRMEQAGLVTKVPVIAGQSVTKGAPLAILSDTGLQADLDAAEARVAQARAQLGTVTAGGKHVELTNIDNDLARAKLERDEDQRDYNALKRLEAKQAATSNDVRLANSKLQEAELEIESLQKRRAALVTTSDKAVAEAQLRDAEAAVRLAKTHLALTIIRAPIAGVVYDLAARPGVYLNVGDLAANVGQTDNLRVRVYVDEPEMGRVQVGEPVTITWDALPERTWQGTVERKPANIMPLGSRQVGEVLVTIDNPGRALLPGTNVNVLIRTATVDNALTIPKECLRRDSTGAAGVFFLRGNKVAWQAVSTGVASVAKVQVTQGLAEGDAVAMPTDVRLKNGVEVTPVYP